MTATYSPEDNKLRLYPSSRLDEETYRRVKDAGFIWAPKQSLFVAPAWTPERADLCEELAGEIGDEDSSLVDRATERAERFDHYQDRRRQDAAQARAAVSAIADNIPLGQPILVGHHSERHARRDAERIENGMRRAIRMWETANYWRARATGARQHAAYKGRPDVRARRIKGLESDLRKHQKHQKNSEILIRYWTHVRDGVDRHGATVDAATIAERARHIANFYDHAAYRPLVDDGIPAADVARQAIDRHDRLVAYYGRWIAHLTLRLEYERAMLEEDGGLPGEQFDLQPGGRACSRRGEWATILRVNRVDGRVVSVRTNARYVPVWPVETIADYAPPTAEQASAVKAATTLAPLTNFDSESSCHLTTAEWKRLHADYRSTRTADATETTGRYRYRVAVRGGALRPVFLTDAKVVRPPAATPPGPPTDPLTPPTRRPLALRESDSQGAPEDAGDAATAALRATLAAGVTVRAVPDLFPTPEPLADRLVAALDIRPCLRILEPSAGTGALLRALSRAGVPAGDVVAVEQDAGLSAALRTAHGGTLHNRNFLEMTADDLGGRFDAVLMNPPFSGGADIRHIEHARRLLAPGGRLVAVCAAGPRQRGTFTDAGKWIDLPPMTFAACGTQVRTAIVILDAPPAAEDATDCQSASASGY